MKWSAKADKVQIARGDRGCCSGPAEGAKDANQEKRTGGMIEKDSDD